jgi:hypothetical protein
MYADVPAITYRASWCDFLKAELTPHLFFNFFTSSCPLNSLSPQLEIREKANPETIHLDDPDLLAACEVLGIQIES